MGMLVLHATTGNLPIVPSAFASPISIQIQRSGKAPSPHVGAAMAVLATLEQARVLPPEGTTEANRIIKSVIQLQALFTTTADSSVQEFMQRAVAHKQKEQTARVLAQFHSSGWTPDVLEALADKAFRSPAEELHRLEPGLRSVNLSVDDFRSFMQLVRDGEQALTEIGKNFHDVFSFHRKTMPGARDGT
ncbi:MAG TPA: hypothetical protein VFX56_05885 [Nitrospira sp.]|nr:hypothetical protein [Nitrospira sp.]